ncbi:MAG TPA: glycosyltransferase [Pyrinomonadaceae bacterium]|jgi:cellulose synthase/poly-beta-1,6-N-acetylglucosamine synthase-like glycosyltransferase
MIFVFCFFAAALVFLSYKSFRGGIEYLNFFRRELARPASDFAPLVSVIAPCRGLDQDLEINLSALFRQDFPCYELIFVVDSERDAAVPVIEKLIFREGAEAQRSLEESSAARRLGGTKLVVAGKAENESQKVHNLREAVLHADGDSEIFVFVDSDARPSRDWLRSLIAPLRDEKIGAATGYRWFIAKKFGFASEMRSVWNASIASALGANAKSNFCWGGSMALRRATFEKIEMREKWRGTLSDDFAVTRALSEAGLPIHFVPQALTASVENCSWRECLEFTTRQMKITRIYAPRLWKMSFIGAAVFNLVWIWGVFNMIFHPADSFPFRFSLAALLLVAIFSAAKSWLRLNAVRLVLKDHERALRKQFWTQNTLWILTPALFFYNSLCALLSRRIVWRGIGYELVSPRETIISNENTTNKRRSSSDNVS